MSVDFTLDDGVAVITINRPEKMNALDPEHYSLLSKAWTRVRDDAEVRVAVITGAGEKSFCAGADLKAGNSARDDFSTFWLTQQDQLLNRGLEVWKPVIAAVNGYCLGGGVTLLFATDIRVASENATFGLSEVKRGILPANGGTQRLLEQLPWAIGMEMLLTGDAMDAQTAERWGLVNKVVPSADLMPTALAYAKKIAANGPLAVQASKELAVRSRDVDRASGLRMEQALARILHTTADAAEGALAFKEKRPPKFIGR